MPLVTKNFSDIITFTRASTATYFNSAGTLTSAAVNEARLDYNPATLAAQGLLIEEARTNSIRNNTMQGAVAGTPGTLPTNWAGSSPIAGLTREVVGTGTQNGINYIDVRFSGTTNTTSANIIFPENNTFVAALNGQSWAASSWIALVGGSFTNITASNLTLRFNDGAGSLLTSNSTSFLGATATQVRYATAGTASNASTAFVTTCIQLGFSNGVAIDITLRIGLPQLERGAFATSVIPTVNAFALGVTREADVASVNTLSPWFNATEGTLYSEATFTNTVSFNTVAALGDGTGSNTIRTIQWNDGTDRIFTITTGGAPQAAFFGTGQVGTAKFAGAYKLNDVNASKNGSIGTTDTAATIPTINALWLGATGSSLFLLNGHLRRITYYPRRLSNAELQAITA